MEAKTARVSWLKRSLGTREQREANILGKPVLMEFDRILGKAEAELKSTPVRDTLSPQEIDRIANYYHAQRLAEDDEIRELGTGSEALFQAIAKQLAADGAAFVPQFPIATPPLYGLSDRKMASGASASAPRSSLPSIPPRTGSRRTSSWSTRPSSPSASPNPAARRASSPHARYRRRGAVAKAGGKTVDEPDRLICLPKQQSAGIPPRDPPPHGARPLFRNRSRSRYTLSASENALESAQLVLAKQVYTVRGPEAPRTRERCS
jgi:hypothetical protein